jgi:hypothetical protein
MQITDFIGDIHGYADKLEELLQKLGYSNQFGYYYHPERSVVFLGDYIDRGPKIKETLKIVKDMVDNSSAIALMGNHEYNAICFNRLNTNGGYLRKHIIKNITQHYQTIKQFKNAQDEYDNYINWFMSLPLLLETEEFRAVHACWDFNHVNNIKTCMPDFNLSDEHLINAATKGSILNNSIDTILKGKETILPKGSFFTDKDGTKRTEIRIKWWENPKGKTYKSICTEISADLPEIDIEDSDIIESRHYLSNEKPVFFGHYWLSGKPSLIKENVCCLDFSIAKGGHLVAYSFKGEKSLNENNFTYV